MPSSSRCTLTGTQIIIPSTSSSSPWSLRLFARPAHPYPTSTLLSRRIQKALGEALTQRKQPLLSAGSHRVSEAQYPVDISLLSVILNVVIISALIPSFRNDVYVMQGRTDEISRSVGTVNLRLDAINKDINTATSAIATFNGDLATASQSVNLTKIELGVIQVSAITDIQLLKVSTLSQLNQSLSQAAALTIEARQLESSVGQIVDILNNITTSSVTTLRQLNNTAVDLMATIRDDFVQRVVPQTETDLLMLSAQLNQQLTNLTQQITQPSDRFHYIGASGEIPFMNGWGVKGDATPPRFWKDRGVVHLDGVIASGDSSQAMFYLPEGYRPKPIQGNEGRKFILIDNGASIANMGWPAGMAQIVVENTGAVTYALPPSSLGGGALIILDGVSFAADDDFLAE